MFKTLRNEQNNIISSLKEHINRLESKLFLLRDKLKWSMKLK